MMNAFMTYEVSGSREASYRSLSAERYRIVVCLGPSNEPYELFGDEGRENRRTLSKYMNP